MIDYGEWHKQKCTEYKTEFPIYEKYASTLDEILKEICRSYAPRAIVQARTKTFSSFAEKMARKAARYMTLGSGRVEVHADHPDQSVQRAPFPGRGDSAVHPLVPALSPRLRTRR
jgi:hypothetical protein